MIGYLYSIGRTIEPDICKTSELWQRAARYRRLAALVALPRHSLRGDFDACGPAIPPGGSPRLPEWGQVAIERL